MSDRSYWLIWLIIWVGVTTFVIIHGARAQEPEGRMGVGHSDSNHAFYSGLFNLKKKMSCCHDKDCRPTVSRMINGHYEVKINGVWATVDQEAIIPKSAPDGGAHICAGDPNGSYPLGPVYCVVLPPET